MEMPVIVYERHVYISRQQCYFDLSSFHERDKAWGGLLSRKGP